MKSLLYAVMLVTGLLAPFAHADVKCIATDMASLKTAITTGDDNKPCPFILVTKDIIVTENLNVPIGTSLLGYIESHPFQQAGLHFKIAAPTDNNTYCAITLDKNSGLANLLITTETRFKNAVCINESQNVITRTAIDAPFVSNGFIHGVLMTAGGGILSDNTINTIKDGIMAGKLPTTFLRNRIATKAVGGVGISLTLPPPVMSGNELMGEAKLELPHDNKLPLGTAANIIKLNNLVGLQDDGSDRSNFYDIYHIFPKFLKPCDAPMGYAPYNEDGSCKSYVFGKTEAPAACPLNQIKLADGSCGCPDTMKLDTTSNLCFQEKIVEKPVEIIVEKPVEVIIEKPVSGESVILPETPPLNPIVANVQGESSCSLITNNEAVSALMPIGMAMLIAGLAGLAAYRFHLGAHHARRKIRE